jgi:threonine aldolase
MIIDLRSDTKSRPTGGMRRAMAAAEVGDEQGGEDPSVNRLCARVAELLGKEAAVFLPSGTMCNAVAIAVHCRSGDEIIAADVSHLYNTEGAGPAALAGAQVRPLAGNRGRFGADQVAAAIRTPNRHAPRSRLVAVEQTVNRGGGAVWRRVDLEAVAEVAHAKGLDVHMDGARLFNAVVASNVAARDYAAPCDSVWLDLSKGLGCPVGAVLAGSRDFIEEAWRWKHRLGGAMRQAGIIAAAGLYALDHHVERLADDHANARRLADLLAAIPGVRLDPPEVETNLVFLDITKTGWTAPVLSRRLREEGIGMGAENAARLRAVTHLDVDRAAVEQAAATMRRLLAETPARADESAPAARSGITTAAAHQLT